MRYFHYKLSEALWGTNPYDAVADCGSLLDPSAYVDDDGYHLAYVTGDCDPDDLDAEWDVNEVTESEALTFAQTIWEDAAVLGNGRISEPPWVEPGI